MNYIVATDNENQPNRNLPPQTHVGNYVILERVRNGGIGAVYKAHHALMPSQIVAIKVHDYFPESEQVGYVFKRSANYLAQLNHSNIVKFLNYGFHDGFAYLVMEFVDGGTLKKKIMPNAGRVAALHMLEYCKQMVEAMRYAHNCKYLSLEGLLQVGIHHGDLKPENILVDNQTDSIKVVDFLMPDVQQFLTQKNPDFRNLKHSTARFGTEGFMPPEQEREGVVNAKTDIFSLGATIYQLFSGNNPILLYAGMTARNVNPFVPKWLDQMITKAMSPEPANRFDSVAEMEAIFLEHRDN